MRLALAGALTAIGAGAIIVGPAAPWLVDVLGDDRRVWRLGHLGVETVTGPHLGALRAGRLTLSDKDGVWAEARDVRVRWSPLALLGGAVEIDAIDAARLHVLRRPVLGPPPPEGGFDPRVDLRGLRVAELTLDAAVAESAATFRADFRFAKTPQRISLLALTLDRTDRDGDDLHVEYRDSGDDLALTGEARSAPGGVLAMLLGVRGDRLRVTANGTGDARGGKVGVRALVGDAALANADLGWRGADWTLSADATLTRAPIFADLAARIGESVTLTAEGVRDGAARARLAAPNLTVAVDAPRSEAAVLAAPAAVRVETPSLARLAPEARIGGARARFVGELAPNEIDLNGELSAEGLAVAGLSSGARGSAHARMTARSISADADLAITAPSTPLLNDARIEARASYGRRRARFGVARATLDGPNARATASGWAASGDGEFSGMWRIKRIAPVAAGFSGTIDGRWRAHADAERGWVLAADAVGDVSGAPDWAASLLGRAPKLNASLSFQNDVTAIDYVIVESPRLRAGARGTIRDGRVAVALEASARGPVELGAGVIIDGAFDATGALSGDSARPRIEASAAFGALDFGGAQIDDPLLTMSLAPDARGDYRGQARAEGKLSGQPATAQAELHLASGSVAFSTLVAELGALHAEGSARFARDGPSANLTLTGALDNLAPRLFGRIAGDLAVTPQAISLDATLTDARFGDLSARRATIAAQGDFARIAARYGLRGGYGRAALALDGDAVLTFPKAGATLALGGGGSLAGERLALDGPTRVTFAPGGTEAALHAAIGAGWLEFSWREDGKDVAAQARLTNAPLAPLAAIWGERAAGRASGTADLASVRGAGLRGALDLAVEGAQLTARSAETIDADVRARLAGERLTASIDARSDAGLRAHFNAEAPVTTALDPIRIAITPQRQGRASWSVSGPVGGLFAAARLNDQTLSGDIEGEGEIAFGEGALTGSGELALSQGAFADKLSGVELRDIDARVRFGPGGAQIASFTAGDGEGGRLSAAGGAVDPSHGEITLTMDDLRLVSRHDASARASGALAFAWEGLHSTLSGTLNISEGTINVAASAAASVPQLDVIEINRPVAEDAPILPAPRVSVSNGSTALDIAVRAPGRIFTRGRGLDAEWSLDLRLAGTAKEPRLFGDATLVRGDLSISGRPFELTQGRIGFNGDPTEAMLDLTAERDSADLTVVARLTGSATNPELQLTSTPALPEEEILPQILFGRSVADLSALEAAQLAGSLSALSGQSSFSLAEAARSIAGLDRLDVRQDEDGGLLVAGGVYLTSDVYLEVARTGLGQASTQVEWRVRPQLVLVTSFLANGDRRASVRWRREYE
jgi:translocation and assembly module TamB